MNVSKSQAKRLAIQTEPIDVDLRVQELAMANGHIEYLRGKLERLQAELEKERRLHGMARSTISSRTAEVDRLTAEVAELRLECSVGGMAIVTITRLVSDDEAVAVSAVLDEYRLVKKHDEGVTT